MKILLFLLEAISFQQEINIRSAIQFVHCGNQRKPYLKHVIADVEILQSLAVCYCI